MDEEKTQEAQPEVASSDSPKASAAEQVEHLSWGDRQKRAMKAMDRRSVYVPRDSGMARCSKFKDHVMVQINGVDTYLNIGQMTEVPSVVADVVEESLRLEQENKERVQKLSDRSKGGVIFNV